jgi:cytochrome P450
MSDELPAALGGFALTDQPRYAGGFPHEVFAQLRRSAPILWHPGVHTRDGEGFWVLSRYADVVAAADLPALSSQGGPGRAGGGTHIDDLQAGVHAGVCINMMDDPRHQLLRELVSPGVARAVLDRRLPAIRAMAAELVDTAVSKGRCDLQSEVTAPFAIQTIALMLGAPESDWPRLVEWAQAVAGLDNRASGKVDDSATATVYAVYEYSQTLLKARRAGEPADDFMSLLAHHELAPHPAERPLSDFEREAFFCLVLMAGSEPSRNTMAGGLLALAQHPDQWQALRADRSLLPGAIEEILRWTSPTPYNRRTATQDLTIGDARVLAGQKVTLWWASANRDEAVFTAAGAFDIRRDPNPHLAFGRGIHSCLGEQLARMEIGMLLTELADRVAEIRLAGPVDWAPSNKHTVVLHVPVELLPA